MNKQQPERVWGVYLAATLVSGFIWFIFSPVLFIPPAFVGCILLTLFIFALALHSHKELLIEKHHGKRNKK